MDYSLPGSSIHEIFQARIMEEVATSFSIPSAYWHLYPFPALHLIFTSKFSEMLEIFIYFCILSLQLNDILSVVI